MHGVMSNGIGALLFVQSVYQPFYNLKAAVRNSSFSVSLSFTAFYGTYQSRVWRYFPILIITPRVAISLSHSYPVVTPMLTARITS